MYASVVAYVGVLLVAPVVAILWGAMREGPVAFVSSLFMRDSLHALYLSIVLTVIAVVANTAFGTLVAWVLTRDRFRGRNLLSGLVDVPFAISPVIVGFALILLFGPKGWLGPIVQATGIKVVFALPGMAIATIFVSIPFVIREVGLVLDQVGEDQEQAAYTLGASALRTFLLVTLPNIRWGLVYGALLTTARALGEFGAILVVSGGIAGLSETGTMFVFRALDDRRDLAAYSMSVALAALSIGLIAIMDYLRRRREAAEGPHLQR
ncbi:MAG: sulfate ABC transporter permease subunit [Deltaproteobacteria bacterium]|nr:sulfate ABC transporter permease subunit [Deltaproteobacteria bacterium]